jgi:glycosyltransferase involved in cell wall biosynthesis
LNRKASVLLITEGTFPYVNGGVSTWAHQLCQGVRDVDFMVYSINALPETLSKYPLGPQVREILQLPMWSPEEPADLKPMDEAYLNHLYRREAVNDQVIADQFCPAFGDFLNAFLEPGTNLPVLDTSLRQMWDYFQFCDFKTTLRSRPAWELFKEVLCEKIPDGKLEDFTTAMRWMYRFLMPLSIPAPEADLVHLTVAGVALFPALGLKYQKGTPILLTEHGVYIRERLLAISEANFNQPLKVFLVRFSEAITRLTYWHAEKITTVSRFNIPWEIRYGADRSRIQVVYNGVDVNHFLPGTIGGTSGNRPTVVAAARIFSLKDIKTMIRTCNEVRKTIPDVQFLVYGNKDAVPEYTRECEELIQNLGLTNHFFLKGHHPNPERIYIEGDISILTSVSEGFPYTVLESMSCGIAVVATRVGGVPEALDDTTGRICPPRDPVALGAAVCELLQDDELRHKLSRNARNRVMEAFTIEQFSESFEEIYRTLLPAGNVYERKIV